MVKAVLAKPHSQPIIFFNYADEYAHRAWVFAEKSIIDALLTLAIPLKISFPPNITEREQLDILLAEMRALTTPCLLVIDNANNLEDLEKYYIALKSCRNFHVMLTSRITQFEEAAQYKITPLADSKVKELFKQYYPLHDKDEDEILEAIFLAIGKNTLVIEILAKSLQAQNWLKTKYTLSGLLSDLQQKGLLQIQSKVISTPYQAKGTALRKEKPEDIIAAMYDMSGLSKAEQRIMSIFAALPAESIPFEILDTLLPNTKDLEETLASLSQKGWLDFNAAAKTFKVSPVVQEVSQIKNETQLEDCKELIDSLIEKLTYEGGTGHFINCTYDEAASFAFYAEYLVSVFTITDNNLAILCERIGNFHTTTGNLQKGLSFFENETTFFEELYATYPNNVSFKNGLAISYSQLGSFYRDKKRNNAKAKEYFQQCYILWEELFVVYPAYIQFTDYFN